jgi:hypothetical protein
LQCNLVYFKDSLILAGGHEGQGAGNGSVLSILVQRKDAEMLQVTDSGCAQHHPRQIALRGATAAWVSNLILNLPLTDAGHTYICEHGCTHCLTFQMLRAKLASSAPGAESEGDQAFVH